MLPGMQWFAEYSWLANSVRSFQEVSLLPILNNTSGLPRVYNNCLQQCHDEAVLAFIHDDIWIQDTLFVEKLHSALNRFDVVGVAGATHHGPLPISRRRRLLMNIFRRFPPALGYLPLGWEKEARDAFCSVSHPASTPPDPGCVTLDARPSLPAEVDIIDALFIAAKAGTLKAVQGGRPFDERFDFHFYDLDFCHTCRAHGLRIGVWPIWVAHKSRGAYGSEAWKSNALRYQDKWYPYYERQRYAAAGFDYGEWQRM